MLVIGMSSIFIQHEIELSDLFAHIGHIILLASAGCVTHSLSYVLSCILVFTFVSYQSYYDRSITYERNSLLYSSYFIILPLCTFLYKFKTVSHINEQWINKTLWMCKFGPFVTISFVAYGVSLFCAYVTCTDRDIVLHALHIGGILVVTIFIYPQVSFRCAKYFRFIICFAALSDSAICGFRVIVKEHDICDAMRAFFALTSAFGIWFVDVDFNQTYIMHNEIHFKRSYMTGIRLLVVICYIIASFVMYIDTHDILISYT